MKTRYGPGRCCCGGVFCPDVCLPQGDLELTIRLRFGNILSGFTYVTEVSGAVAPLSPGPTLPYGAGTFSVFWQWSFRGVTKDWRVEYGCLQTESEIESSGETVKNRPMKRYATKDHGDPWPDPIPWCLIDRNTSPSTPLWTCDPFHDTIQNSASFAPCQVKNSSGEGALVFFDFDGY